jgi:O-antigen/teichoic acid export membrane protein
MPMMASTGLGILLTSADKVFVSHVMGSAALAYYSIGADLCTRVYFVVWALTGSIYTVLLRRHATRQDVTGLFRLSLAVVIAVAVCFYLPLATFARPLLSLWLGPDFAGHAAGAVRYYALAAVAYLFACVYHNFIQASGYPRVLLSGTVTAVCVMGVGLYLVRESAAIESVAFVMITAFGAQVALLAAAKHLFLARLPQLAPASCRNIA